MSEPQLIWLDGSPATSLPLPDRGLDFGDGLFETLLIKSGTPLFLDAHLKRYRFGCERLSLPDVADALTEQIEAFCTEIATLPWAVLRATITRGAGQRGYAPPAQASPRILLIAYALGRDAFQQLPPAQLVEAEHRLALQPSLAGIKHLNRLEQVLIATQVLAAGADEALVYDCEGRAVCGSASNLFFVIDGAVHTPKLESAGISGTRRELVLNEWLGRAGMEGRVGDMVASDIEKADAVFLTNSLVGVRPVGAIGDRRFDDHSVAAALFSEFVRSCA